MSKMTTLVELSYDNKKQLGRGSFGIVYKGYLKESSKKPIPVAVKQIQKGCISECNILSEVEIMKKAGHHPNILRIFRMETTDDYLYIVTELCIGTLEEYVKKTYNGPTFESEREMMFQVTQGLARLHQLNIVHRDIKPGNILIFVPSSSSEGTKTPLMKLADFGISKFLKTGQNDFTNTNPTNPVGTKGWMPPEVFEEERFDFEVDIWALGCVFAYTLSGGKHPFGDDPDRRQNSIRNKESMKLTQNDFKEPYSSDSCAFELIESMLVTEPSKRLTVTDVENHLFFTSSKNKIITSLEQKVSTTEDEGQPSIPNSDYEGVAIINVVLHNTYDNIEKLMRIINDLTRKPKMSWKSLLGMVISVIFAILLFGQEQKRKHTARTTELLKLSSSKLEFTNQDVEIFTELVKNAKVDINATDTTDGMNPLLKLTRNYGHKNLIKLVQPLIERGIDVNATDNNGWNALHNLCRYYEHENLLIKLIRLLEENNIDMEAETNEGYTAYHLAEYVNPATFISGEISKILFKEKDLMEVVKNKTIKFGQLLSSPTKLTSYEIALFTRLVKDKSSIDVNKILSGMSAKASKGGQYLLIRDGNALHFLCRFYQHENLIDLARPLIENGININAQDSDGRNALHFLCWYYHHDNLFELIQFFIDKGVDVNAQTKAGWTPLHIIYLFNRDSNLINLTKLLTEKGEGIGLNAQTKRGWSPLHVLFRYYRVNNVITNSLEWIGDLLFKHDRQSDSLVALTKLLISRKVNLNARNLRGWTPLHHLCRFYQHDDLLDVVLLLKEEGVDLTVKTEEGYSASYLLKTVYWYPPKDRDRIIEILPEDENESIIGRGSFYWLKAMWTDGPIDDSL